MATSPSGHTATAVPSNADLGHRVRSGFALTGGAQGVRQAVEFVTSIALARLLVPADFGIVAVIATPLPAVKALGDVVRCCDTADTFEAAVAAALETLDDTSARAARQQRARDFDWATIAAARLEVIQQYLRNTQPELRAA